MLVPPLSFGLVEEGIYRCSKVETLNLSFLETLNLKIIIFLSGEEPSRFFKDFFNSWSIEWIVINPNSYTTITSTGVGNLTTSNDRQEGKNGKNFNGQNGALNNSGNLEDGVGNKKLTSSIANDYSTSVESNGLMILQSPVLEKIFQILMDKSSYNCLLVDNTSIVVGVLRKVLKWNISSIINEYRLFAGKNRNYFSESFLELVQVNVEQKGSKSEQNTNIKDSFKSDVRTKNIKDTAIIMKNINPQTKKSNQIKAAKALNFTKLNKANQSIIVDDQNVSMQAQDANDKLEHHIRFSDHSNINNLVYKSQKLNDMHIITEKDLDTFEPEVPAILLTMIEDVEKIQKQELADAKSEKEKMKKKETEEHISIDNGTTNTQFCNTVSNNTDTIKKSTSALGIFGNKYRLAFDSETEKTDFEYYKSSVEKKLEEQNEKIKHETIISNIVTKIDKHNKNGRPNLMTLTIRPKIYLNKEQKVKNERLLDKYGANINRPYNFNELISEKSVPVSLDSSLESAELGSSVESSLTEHNKENLKKSPSSINSINLVIAREELLPDWFKLQRDIWERTNTVDHHTESVFIL